MSILSVAAHGLNMPDLGLAVLRIAAGSFFAISGFNKLANRGRHQSLKNNLVKNGIPYIGVMQWWVPGWEFAAGVLLTIGLLTSFSATVLIIICIVACCCEARSRVAAYHPINALDVIDDYLYLQEVLYLVILLAVVFAGSGKYSVDAFIFLKK